MTSESSLIRRLRAAARLPNAAAPARLADTTAPPVEDPGPRSPAARPSRRLIVCGDDPLAHRLIEELVARYPVEVTAVLPSVKRHHGPQIAALVGKDRIVQSDRLDEDTLRSAGIATADAIAFIKQDDVGNIHAALLAQELNPKIRMVVRMFNTKLGRGIKRLFPDCRVLSDARMATPAFVSAALGEVAPVHLRVAGRTLHVAHRAEVQRKDVLCGLAVTEGEGEGEDTELLPEDDARADLVLAVARGEQVATVVEATAEYGDLRRRVERTRRRREAPTRLLRTFLNRRLRVAALSLVGLLVVGTGVLALVKHISWPNAAYLTILTALGGANADLAAKPAEKITQTVLTVVSIALIPVITAAVVEAVVNARLAFALGRLETPISDHVIVVGLGNVGTRVMHDLVDLGVPVVAVDKSETARGVQGARSRGIPLIIGDASQADVLAAASIATCRALVVVSTDDVTNLETALQARDVSPDLRLVLRLFDGDFANRVQHAFGITISRSVSYLAAPAFAAALLEREVIGTIPVNRKVLLLAEAPIAAGSALDGGPLSQAQAAGGVRVLAITVDEGRTTIWAPPAEYVPAAGDLLTVVATRRGLGQLLSKSGASAEPDATSSDLDESLEDPDRPFAPD